MKNDAPIAPDSNILAFTPAAMPGSPAQQALPVAPAYRLHGFIGVLLGSLLGSYVIGAVFIALNYRRMGNRKGFWLSLLGLVGLYLVVTAIAQQFTFASGLLVANLMGVVVLMLAMRHFQSGALADHEDRGGKFYSRWRTALTGLAFTITMMLAILWLSSLATGV